MSEQAVRTSEVEGLDNDRPFVVIDGKKFPIDVVNRGLIPPWEGFSLRLWWKQSRLNPRGDASSRR